MLMAGNYDLSQCISDQGYALSTQNGMAVATKGSCP
jgi:hypothetical protein